MASEIPFTIAFLAGVFSFLSPCVLPIVPGFMSYIIGQSYTDLLNSNKQNKIKNFRSIILFISGFSVIFITMGASIDFLSDILFEFRKQLNFISGLLIIFLGLFFIGLIKINALSFEKKINFERWNNSSLFPFLIGVAFAFGWTPCIGPILGAILSMSAQAESFHSGVILMAVYAVGLGCPFLLFGVFFARSLSLFSPIKMHLGKVEKAMGILLLVVGILLFSGGFTNLSFLLLETLPFLTIFG